ncbi:unnamed protein product [Auanema sp. JU1783]|nr:unnamed protein product [Auanema sp. JU1783]
MTFFYILLLTFLLQLKVASCLNVLVWCPTLGQSHVNFMGRIADTLQEDGHNVTMLMIENDPDIWSTGTSLVKHVVWYTSPLVDKTEWATHNFKKGNVFQTKTFDLADFMSMQDINYRTCQSMINDEAFLSLLKSSHFDLAIMEMFHFCPAGILHIAGVPKIIMASALGITPAHMEILDVPTSLSFVPTFLTHMGSKMTLLDRMYNVVFSFSSKILYWKLLYSEQALIQSKFPNFPCLYQLFKSKLDYLLLNTNEFTESTRPTLSSIKYVGGVTTDQPKELQPEFDSILSRGQKGTVFFSLGSLVKSSEMPTHIRRAFFEAFLSFPEYEFIWKDDVASNFSYPNIHFRRWVPQVDLLADPRLKLFITHGGMNSIQEALLFGVPMITMPLFADQDANAALAAERGYSYTLNKFSITKEEVIRAIRSVLGVDGEESVYLLKARQAARVLKGSSRLMKNEIQRVVRLSGSEPTLNHLKLDLDHLNTLQYFNVDVYLIFSCFIMLLLISSCKIINYYINLNFVPAKQKIA